MPISVDSVTKVVSIPQTYLSVQGTFFVLDTDKLRKDLRTWEASPEGRTEDRTHKHNTAVLLGGVEYARVLKFLPPYTFTFEEKAQPYAVSLFGSNNNLLERTNLGTVQILSNNSAGLLNVREVQHGSFDGGVTLDVDNVTGHAVNGVNYPAGSPSDPIDNLAEGLSILVEEGFDKIFVKGDLTIGASDVISNLRLYGQGATLNIAQSTLSFIQGCNTHEAHIYDCLVTGYQGGENFYHNCIIENLDNFHCFFDHCGFKDGTANTFTIRQSQASSRAHVTYFKDCYVDEGVFIVDRDNARPTMRFDGHSGDIKFINQNHVDVGDVYIHMRGGHITLDATVTEGYFHITGDYELKNFSGANVSVHSSQDIAAEANWNQIIEGTYTGAEIMRAVAAVLAGKVSGGQSGVEIFRNLEDTKNRVTSTVDANGNRTNIVLDVTP